MSFTGSPSAIAVSGGGDSVALMHLFAGWAKAGNRPMPAVLTVDHGLRAHSAEEAAHVARWAKALGFAAHVLRWRGAKPRANVEEEARAARYALMGEWCRAHGARTLFLAHTEDDQAETFLLRLGRGSGVDGLSAMRMRAPFPLPGFEDVELMRPLLGVRRSELRAFLETRSAPWLEDPMNEDPRFARTRIRRALPLLEAAGVPVPRVAQAAAHLARAREALDAATGDFLALHARFDPLGAAFLDAAALSRAPREIGLRALSRVLMGVSGQTCRPRFERLEALYQALIAEEPAKGRTLHGCRIGRAPKAQGLLGSATLKISRERARKSARKSEKDH